MEKCWAAPLLCLLCCRSTIVSAWVQSECERQDWFMNLPPSAPRYWWNTCHTASHSLHWLDYISGWGGGALTLDTAVDCLTVSHFTSKVTCSPDTRRNARTTSTSFLFLGKTISEVSAVSHLKDSLISVKKFCFINDFLLFKSPLSRYRQ